MPVVTVTVTVVVVVGQSFPAKSLVIFIFHRVGLHRDTYAAVIRTLDPRRARNECNGPYNGLR